MSCDVGKVTERLENELCYDYNYELCSFSNLSVTSPTSPLPHSPTFPSLHLRHSTFSNPSVTLPTSQLILQPFRSLPTSQFILQPFFRFSYVTSSSFNSPGEPPIFLIQICYCAICRGFSLWGLNF